MRIAFTYFADGIRNSKSGTVHEADALAFFARLTKPRETTDKYDVPAFATATFLGSRSLDHLARSHALGLDVDDVADLEVLFGAFAKLLSIVYTTYSSTPERPRARAFVIFSRPVDLGEYRRLAGFFVGRLTDAGNGVDRDACRDAARAWPLPAIPHGGHFVSRMGRGDPLDVNALLSTLPPEAPPPPPRPVHNSTAEPRVIDRARAYVAKCEPAISGSGGHKAAFAVAQRLVRGFGLDVDTAFDLAMNEYNPRCQPPFLARDWVHKIKQAAQVGRMPEGALRDAPRRTA